MSGCHCTSLRRLGLLVVGLVSYVTAECSNEETSTMTAYAEVSSLAASCATYLGDLAIVNATGTIDLSGMETIVGEILYENVVSPGNVKIYSSTLKNITNGLTANGAPEEYSGSVGGLNVSLPALESIWSFTIYDGWDAVSLNTNPELDVTTWVSIRGNRHMQTPNLYLNFTSAKSISVASLAFTQDDGESFLFSTAKIVQDWISISSTEGLKRVVLDDLEFMNFTMHITGNSDLDYISSSVVDAALMTIRRNGRAASLFLPKLESLGGRSDPTAYTYTGDAGGVFHDLVNINLPLLKKASGDVQYKGRLNFTSNLFSELYLPSLETANCTLGIDDNVALNDIWIPRLSYAKELEVHLNPRLLNFTANLLKKADKVNMTGAFTNVELFSLEEVTGDFFIEGAETMDCSWFDEHFLNKVVKGAYKCVGNHTKPAVERTPSTPTDLAQLEAWEGGKGGDSGDGKDSTAGDGSDAENSSSGGLSTGAKAGIGAGVGAAVLIALVLGSWLFVRKRRASQDTATDVRPSGEAGGEKAELHGESGTSAALQGDDKKAETTEIADVGELPDTMRSELPGGGTQARAELAG